MDTTEGTRNMTRPRVHTCINHDQLPIFRANMPLYKRLYGRQYYQTVEDAKEKKREYYQKNKEHILARVSKSYFFK